MKIKSMTISNHRKIKEIQKDLEDNITVFADVNNSGKPSLLEFFDSVFFKSEEKNRLIKNDFPIESCEKWMERSFSSF